MFRWENLFKTTPSKYTIQDIFSMIFVRYESLKDVFWTLCSTIATESFTFFTAATRNSAWLFPYFCWRCWIFYKTYNRALYRIIELISNNVKKKMIIWFWRFDTFFCVGFTRKWQWFWMIIIFLWMEKKEM